MKQILRFIGLMVLFQLAGAEEYKPPRFADIEGSPYHNGQIVEIDAQTRFVIGQAGGLEPLKANSSNVLLHRSEDTLHIVDSGALLFYRKAILKAAHQLGRVKKVVLINTHSHTDHLANNDLIYDIPAQEHFLLMPRLTLEHSRDQAAYYAGGTGRIQAFSERVPHLVKSKDSTREEWVRLLEPFKPMKPMLDKAIPLEHLPLQRLELGEMLQIGWKVTPAMYAIPTRGHTDDSVIVYFPRNKLLFMGDETNRAYHIFLDGDGINAFRLFRDVLEMIDAGQVRMLLDSHHYHLFDQAEARRYMELYLTQEEYEQVLLVRTLNTAGKRGLRLDELITELSRDTWWNERYRPGHKSKFPIAIPMLLLKRMRDIGAEEVGEPPNSRFRLRHDPSRLLEPGR